MQRYLSGVLLAVVAGAWPAAVGLAAQSAEVVPGSLTLDEAIESSLEHNASLRQKLRGLDAARAQVREAWGSVMPQATFSASYTRNLELPQFFLPARFLDPDADPDALVPVQAGADNAWFAQARADQPLFNAAAFLGVGAADRYETLQVEVVRGEAQQVATRARLRYYDVMLAREQVELTGRSLARVEQVLDETRKLHAAGLASEYAVLRLEVERSNLEPNLRRAENGLASARRALAVEMGVDTLHAEPMGSLLALDLDEVVVGGTAGAGARSTSSSGRGTVVDRPVRAESLPAEEAVRLAAEHRSDLRQLGLVRELRETERRVEMSRYLPQISLFGAWSMNAQGNDRPVWFGENRFSTTAVGIQVDIPLFSGLQRPARVSRMGAVVREVEAQIEYARGLAENEVKTLREQALESYDRAGAQRRAVDQARRGFEIARAEYRAGTVGQLQVTDAELALRQSEFNYAQAVYDYLTAQARLDAAIGMVPRVDDGGRVAWTSHDGGTR